MQPGLRGKAPAGEVKAVVEKGVTIDGAGSRGWRLMGMSSASAASKIGNRESSVCCAVLARSVGD